MAINGIYTDTRVRLKLDPGEFGFSYGTSLARTPAAISAQELGNVIGLRREALAKGLDVDFAQISLTPGLSPSGPTVQSGRTEVRFADKPGIPQALQAARGQQQQSAAQAATPFTNPLLSALDAARQFVEQFMLGEKNANDKPAEKQNNALPIIERFKNADTLGNVEPFKNYIEEAAQISNENNTMGNTYSFFDLLKNFLTLNPIPRQTASGFFVNSLA